MTTHPTPRAPAKLPKAHFDLLYFYGPGKDFWCAVIPCRKQSEARAIVRLHSMQQEDRIELLIKTMRRPWPIARLEALAVIKALNLPTP